jgi:hypothetical protein
MNVAVNVFATFFCERNYYDASVSCVQKYLCDDMLKREVLEVSDICYRNQYKNARQLFVLVYVSFLQKKKALF